MLLLYTGDSDLATVESFQALLPWQSGIHWWMLLHLHLSRNLASRTGSFIFFWQKDTKTGLECPARSSKAPIGSGYKSLAEHLIQFQMHGCLPLDTCIDIKRLDYGDGIEDMMMRHRSCWHKACRVKSKI